VLSVPLLAPGDEASARTPLGVLTLGGGPDGERFTAGDAKMATTIATQLAAAIQTGRLVESRRQAERLQRDLEIAATIQRTLLPNDAPQVPGTELAARCEPAGKVGGDYFDHVVGADGRLYLLVADVAGHSIGSALMMAMARAVLRRAMKEGRTAAGVLRRLNDALFDDLDRAELFITGFCATYDPATGELRWGNGGQNRPALVRAGGTLEDLDAEGMPAGILPEVEFEEGSTRLLAGDVLVLYTDGVVEARDPAGELFGEGRLHSALREVAGRPPHMVLGAVLDAVAAHRRGGTPDDDVTVLVLRAGPVDGSRS
jgi:sigma-B regulation protein RsbU (phosphoserine phosphatase)